MGITLILLGVGCVVAAMVGGGVKAGALHIPRFASIPRQWMLGTFGLALAVTGVAAEKLPQKSDEPSPYVPNNGTLAQVDPASATGNGSTAVEPEPDRTPADEPDPDAEAEDPSPPARARNVTGNWLDQYQNLHEFDPAQGIAALTLSELSQRYIGTLRVDGSTYHWTTGGSRCSATMSSDPDLMSGFCQGIVSGQRFPVTLKRQ